MAGIASVARAVRRGGVALYPTESFYALGADATNARAVNDTKVMKRRGKLKPIACIAGSMKQVRSFFILSTPLEALARNVWPGPVTILLRPRVRTPSLSPLARGRGIAADALLGTTPARSNDRATPPHMRRGRGGIGVRVPSHALARRLALAVGRPITATSANVSGKPPTKHAREVQRQFPRVPLLSGRCGTRRLPSTVVTVHNRTIRVLRHGAVTLPTND